MDKPSIGRIVHFVEVHGKHHAALIIDVLEGSDTCVDLAIFHSQLQGTLFVKGVNYEWPPVPEHSNTWHWPERVG